VGQGTEGEEGGGGIKWRKRRRKVGRRTQIRMMKKIK
jgi:hypothetical protein